MPRIVIVGGSFAAGIAVQTIAGENKNADVTLISESTHTYFNPATPRLLVEPEQVKKSIHPVEQELKKKLPKAKFVHARVESVDFEKKVVHVSGAAESQIPYDFVIIATGARSITDGFKLSGTHTETIDKIKNLSEQIKGAKTIALIGGGSTGVETSAEIANKYKDKKVTLYTGSSGPLESLGRKRSAIAATKLKKVGVEVVNKIRSKSVETQGSKTTVTFDDGTTKQFDLVVYTIGVTPNSEFLPSEVLNKDGYLSTNDTFGVKGYESSAFGLGDIASVTDKTIVDIKMAQAGTFKGVVHSTIYNKGGSIKPYKPLTSTTIVIPITESGGIGVVFGWGIPDFLVRLLKSKDFMLSKADTVLKG